MINAESIENSGIEIVNVHRVFDDVVSEIVCFAIYRSSFYSSSGHPFSETFGVVVSSVIGFRERALAIDGSTEFSTPDNQRVIEHASLL